MQVEGGQLELLEQDLRNFKKLLERSLRSESESETRASRAKLELKNLERECEILREENEQLSRTFHDRLLLISTFINEFRKNLLDIFSLQKGKQELLVSLKELTESSARTEREVRKGHAALSEKTENLNQQKAVLERLERRLASQVGQILAMFAEVVQGASDLQFLREIRELRTQIDLKEQDVTRLAGELNKKSLELEMMKLDFEKKVHDRQGDVSSKNVNFDFFAGKRG